MNVMLLTLVSGLLIVGRSDDKEEMEPTPVIRTSSGTVAFNNIGARAFLFTAALPVLE